MSPRGAASPREARSEGAATSSEPSEPGAGVERRPRWVGRVIADRYRIVRHLGSGGMGEVYEAEQIRVKRRLAIKFLLPQYRERASMLTRFRREAEAAGRLEHENIAAAIDFGDDDGVPYLVMEFLEGVDLARLLREQSGQLPAPRAVEIALQACRGVSAAHALRIVHRDLKPQNLFVSRRGDGGDLVKILDFGVAKMLLDGASSATQTATAPGTPCYMSPEQARGDERIDARTDVYSLGLILYECLAGTRPYSGDSYNAVLHQVLTQRPAPLGALRPGLPTRLVRAVERAIEFEAVERWPSSDAFAEELRRVQGELRARAEPIEEPLAPGLATEPARLVRAPGSVSASAPRRAGDASSRGFDSGDTGEATGTPWIDSGESAARPARWKLVVAAAIGLGALSTWWAVGRSTAASTAPSAVSPGDALPVAGGSAMSPSHPSGPSHAATSADSTSSADAPDGDTTGVGMHEGSGASAADTTRAPGAATRAPDRDVSTSVPPSPPAATSQPAAARPAKPRDPSPSGGRFDRLNPYE